MKTRRSILRGAAALGVAGLLPHPAKAGLLQSAGRVLTREMFGAKGDGVTNDSTALAELSKVVNANRGGTVELAPGKPTWWGASPEGRRAGAFRGSRRHCCDFRSAPAR